MKIATLRTTPRLNMPLAPLESSTSCLLHNAQNDSKVDTVEVLDQVAMGVVALLLAAISMRDFGPAHQ